MSRSQKRSVITTKRSQLCKRLCRVWTSTGRITNCRSRWISSLTIIPVVY